MAAACLRAAAFVVIVLALSVRPALAQSVLRDAETEALFHEISAPLIAAAGLDPNNVKVVLIGDKEINAFVAGGQVVYINSGLVIAADNVNELQGVIAHELGHVAGGHVISSAQGAASAGRISILSLLLGAAAMAAGAGEAGMGVMAMGQQAAMGKYLAFSRDQESSADQAGARYLRLSHISGKGSLSFFKKLQQQEFRLAIPQDDGYGRTHPLTGDRLSALEQVYHSSPYWDTPTDPKLDVRFQLVKAKLIGYVQDPPAVLQKYPERDKSAPAHYARAYAYHRSAYPEKALEEADALVALKPDDPYALELKGQILLESGKPADALPPLRQAVKLLPAQPLIASSLGQALMATENPANFAEAKSVLRTAVSQDRENPFAWYQLGLVYAREGDEARSALASAERYDLEGEPKLAMASADRAMQGIPPYTPDWLRAQDISMVAHNQVDGKRKKGK